MKMNCGKQFEQNFEDLSPANKKRVILYMRYLKVEQNTQRAWFHFLFPWLPEDLLKQVWTAAPLPYNLNKIIGVLIYWIPDQLVDLYKPQEQK